MNVRCEFISLSRRTNQNKKLNISTGRRRAGRLIAKVNKMKMTFTLPYIIGTLGTLGAVCVPESTSANETSSDAAPDATKNITLDADTTMATFDPAILRLDSIIAAQMRPQQVREKGRDVIYICGNGSEITRRRGTRAWRNNNPGNLRYGKFARENGAIGECGKFAVFPDEETGMKALCKLLESDSYRNLSIGAAVRRYAPACQNNVSLYTNKLKKLTGLKQTTKLGELSADQLQEVAVAIRSIEGWIAGTELRKDAEQQAQPIIAQTPKANSIRDTILREMAARTL